MWLSLCKGDGDLIGGGSRASAVHAVIECHLDELDDQRSIEHQVPWLGGGPASVSLVIMSPLL
jgi:hypothetical protein